MIKICELPGYEESRPYIIAIQLKDALAREDQSVIYIDVTSIIATSASRCKNSDEPNASHWITDYKRTKYSSKMTLEHGQHLLAQPVR